jgi:hypothetical protein
MLPPSIVRLLLMRLAVSQASARPSGAGGDLRAGIAYIVSEPKVRLLLLQVGLLGVFGLAYVPLLSSFARDVLGGDALVFGLVASAGRALRRSQSRIRCSRRSCPTGCAGA